MKIFITGIFIFIHVFSNAQDALLSWTNLENGLSYASVKSPEISEFGDSKIDFLKIDPHFFNFNLICAEQKKSKSKTLEHWCTENKMIAGVNAGMFKLEEDFKTSTGFMKNGSYVNNKTLNPSYKNILAFNTADTSFPSAHILDISCEDWKVAQKKYQSFSQCIRMMDCNGKNTWQKQPKKWSMVLMGENATGEILFIFVRSPYQVHQFVDILLALPLNLKRLMYLEGGPEASFYLDHPKMHVAKFGSYETGFNLNDTNDRYWDIPNVIGISRRKK